MEKPKNLYIQPINRTKWWGTVLEDGRCREEGDKGDNKIGTTLVV